MRSAQELRELLSQDGFARPLRLAREKVEVHGAAAGTITLTAVSPEELRCLTGVLGRRWRAPVPGEDVAGLSLRRLDGALRESRFACTLPEALELLAGEPLANHRVSRATLREEREAVWARASAHPAAADPAPRPGWSGREGPARSPDSPTPTTASRCSGVSTQRPSCPRSRPRRSRCWPPGYSAAPTRSTPTSRPASCWSRCWPPGRCGQHRRARPGDASCLPGSAC